VRALALVIVLGVAGCDATPASLGITGPGTSAVPPRTPDDGTLSAPGIPDPPANGFGPSFGPSPNNGPYFNYN
jgi:hypothetical protein